MFSGVAIAFLVLTSSRSLFAEGSDWYLSGAYTDGNVTTHFNISQCIVSLVKTYRECSLGVALARTEVEIDLASLAEIEIDHRDGRGIIAFSPSRGRMGAWRNEQVRCDRKRFTDSTTREIFLLLPSADADRLYETITGQRKLCDGP